MSHEVTERPILFSGPMVSAILDDGRKSQTRRAVKPQLGPEAYWMPWEGIGWKANGLLGDIPEGWSGKLLQCPYGEIGDRLWVRETWKVTGRYRHDVYEQCLEYRADHSHTSTFASPEIFKLAQAWFENRKNSGWGTPIHMPRWASRILLEITSVSCERLQDISVEDVFAEGVQIPVNKDGNPIIQVSGKFLPAEYVPDGFFATKHKWSKDDEELFIKSHYAALWDRINGQGSWASNPWVFKICFKRVT